MSFISPIYSFSSYSPPLFYLNGPSPLNSFHSPKASQQEMQNSLPDDAYMLPESTHVATTTPSENATSLTYSGISIADELLYQIAHASPELEELSFEHCTFVTATSVQLLAPLKRLHTLLLRNCQNITPITLECIARLHHIRNLDLSDCQGISRGDVHHFLTSIPVEKMPPFTVTSNIENMPIEDMSPKMLPKPPLAAEANGAMNRAFKSMQALQGLQHGMTESELYRTCLYIETVFTGCMQANQPLYHKRNLPGLPRSVQYDPANHNIYIHLKARNVREIGNGGFKTATYSILYTATPPDLVVQLTGKPTHPEEGRFESYENEVRFLRLLNGLPGIVTTYSIMKVPYKDGPNVRYTYVQKLYNKTNLGSIDLNTLTDTQKEDIALSVLEGLKNMHGRKITHGDLGADQLLVEFIPQQDGQNAKAQAVIADFGEAAYTSHSNLKEELNRLGEILTPLFFNKQIQYDEHEIEVDQLLEKIDAKITSGKAVSRKMRIQQVILQMMLYGKSPSDTAAKAYKNLKKVIESRRLAI